MMSFVRCSLLLLLPAILLSTRLLLFVHGFSVTNPVTLDTTAIHNSEGRLEINTNTPILSTKSRRRIHRNVIRNQRQSLYLSNNKNNNDVINDTNTRDKIHQVMGQIMEHNTDNNDNNDAKQINLELVEQGQQFDSYRRRFDYFTTTSTNNNNNKDSSLWKRRQMDENDNQQMIQFLIHCIGLSEEDARQEVHQDVIQYFQRYMVDASNTSTSSATSSSTHSLVGMGLQFQTHVQKGRLITDLLSSTDGDDGDDEDSSSQIYKTKSRWKGNKYVTLTYLTSKTTTTTTDNNNNDDEILIQRVERHLEFSDDSDDSTVSPLDDDLVMIVNTTLYEEGGYKETMSCQETFVRMYNNDDNEDDEISSILQSRIERVPGCIANVNVRTVLQKSNDREEEEEQQQSPSSYQVFIDGEADALLSRGLLAVFSRTLSHPSFTAQDILTMDPSTLADDMNLGNILSKGRNDGLASMLSVIQNQIQNLFEEKDTISNDNNDEVSSSDDTKEQGTKSVKKQPTVAMLLSGGVDSSVALNLLLQQGYNVTAFYLKIWLEDELAHLGDSCPWEDDYQTCMNVCDHAGGVPLETVSLQEEYKEKVISYTINEARKGRTPNPDIMCNSRVKFGCFYDAIEGRDFDYVASGHYAQLKHYDNNNQEIDSSRSDDDDKTTILPQLLRAPDPIKDQSYFLAALTQSQLKRVLFPIGHLQKSQVRDIAEELNLPNKKRADSQGLCFLGKVKFDEFIGAYLGTDPGDIVDADTGEVIGNHKGLWFHTVGQRKGIGKSLYPKVTSRGPWYVVSKDPSKRIIFASNKYDDEIFETTRSKFHIEDIKWISNSIPSHLISEEGAYRLSMKIRHGPTIVTGNLYIDDGGDQTKGRVELDNKDGGLAPGQFVAFYDGITCLGSGVISEALWMSGMGFTHDREEVHSE